MTRIQSSPVKGWSARTRVRLVTLLGAVSLATGCSQTSPLEAAKEECAPGSSFVNVLDDGNGLDVSGEGKDQDGADIDEIACVLVALEMPQSVGARIDRTRALDGTQTASWGEITASWTYHPDSGLSLILERRG